MVGGKDEISQIRAEQLRGIRPDPVTGEPKGYLEVVGKGGKEREC